MSHIPTEIASVRLGHNGQLCLQSHGWPLLAPVEPTEKGVFWAVELPSKQVATIYVRCSAKGRRLAVYDTSQASKMGISDRRWLTGRVRWMFRADEDFGPFWEKCSEYAELRPCTLMRAGALFRSATVYEDIVKTICTVNCHWRNTKRMLTNLCRTCGRAVPNGDRYTFPQPYELAAASDQTLKEAGLGFRADWIKNFSARITAGEIDPELWIDEKKEKLVDQLESIPGIGPYAAAHMLVMLGHYDAIPCDSEVCSYLGLPAKTHPRLIRREAERRYGDWGRFAFLAYKFERIVNKNNYVDC